LVAALLSAANRASTLEATTSTALVGSTALTTTATENGATATAETALLDASVIDDGERGLVLGGCDSEEVGGTGTVHLLVSETTVVLRTLVLTLLGLSSPVGHAAKLVALGERSIWHTRKHVIGRGGGAPGVLRGEGGHQVGERSGRHFYYDLWAICAGQLLKNQKYRGVG
jgi:hypothetical protein